MLSPQKSEYSADMVKTHRIGFPMLRDLHNEVAAKYGVAFTFPDYLNDVYEHDFGINSMEWNDTPTWQLPMPSRFIIDPGGTIVDAEADPDYTIRPEPETILDVLNRLRAER